MELNKIYNDDCIEVMKKIPNETVDLIVTDPPYLVNYKTSRRKDKNHRFNKVILNDNNEELIKKYINECYRILKQNSAMYMFCSSSKVDFFKSELEKQFNIKNMIIWQKNNHTAGDLKSAFGRRYELIFLVNKGHKNFNGERLTDIWNFNKVPNEILVHQNQKPLHLIERCIEKHSFENDLVFDGFMGSGTTAIAAMNTNRKFLGCELDKGYFEIAQNRIKNTIPFKQINLFDF
ncbi:DNA-methyltransferase [Staphylococcus hominis]|uniref:DNA-methyltransferase n=1 Tax=Staphylococcus hominis TaxID=1290 RepID=UPI00188721D3|nr:site-specific DNA-methyltransferase [Staphylococcus hominis]MBF2307768.1 site-specific DNA-methyltransferase [Staphylococcus hominis]MBF2316780.1 site-specific DNA-methyltransferase [Staphylococcus hominis]MBF2321066.1 site-specific DNA-methyltransferase [Staphylococcus hominis]